MSRSVRSNLITLVVVATVLVAVLLTQLPDAPPPRITTVKETPVSLTVTSGLQRNLTVRAIPIEPVRTMSAREARDRRLFEAWVRAVAALAHQRRVAFLRSARELHEQPFLVCVRAHESDEAGGYRATDGGRGGVENMGAYQFDQSTWDSAARHAGAGHLVGVRPTDVAGWWQDNVAWAWYRHVGPRPWAGSGCY